MAARDLKRLGQGVMDRRGELDQTQEEFAAAGGLAVKTVQRVERALIDMPRTKTLGGLDKAAGWVSGSARGLLEEGRPPTLRDQGDAHLYERVLRDEVEEALMDITELPEENRWAKIFQRRTRIAESQDRQGLPMDQEGT
jgi:transcriptional regulator with XRE-family HTH domain